MKVVIATGRQAHYRLAANAFVRRGFDVALYSATPRSRMRGFNSAVANVWIPAPVAMLCAATHSRTPLILDELDSVCFDNFAASVMPDCDLLLGASTSSLATGKATKRSGGTYVLDRACPDIRVQQQLLSEEARKVGGTFRRNSPWFINRQVEEYENADFILAPSDYSRRSYPDYLRKKVVLAPLYGCSAIVPRVPRPVRSTFVLGVVGGSPLRKGLLYLLRAWEKLALPNALLKIRTSNEVLEYPILRKLIATQSTVSISPYVPHIEEFYRQCDAFIQPSVDDGFGLALMEALAIGLPSIATRNCGASEMLVADRDCLLIDPFNVEQIQRAILQLYESRDLRNKLEVNGPKAVASLQHGGRPSAYEQGLETIIHSITI